MEQLDWERWREENNKGGVSIAGKQRREQTVELVVYFINAL